MLPKYRENLFQIQWKKILMTSLSLVVLSALFAFIAYASTNKSVTVVANGKVTHYQTHAGSVADLLNSQGIHPKSHDLLEPSSDTKIKNKMTITWKPAKHITVSYNDHTKQYWTTVDTVGHFMKQQDIHINNHDKITPSLDSPIKNHMHVSFDSSFMVHLDVGGKSSQVWSTSTTVADFLKQHDIKLGKDDKVEPNLNKVITDKTDVKVIRVKKVTDVVEAPIDYRTITKDDSSLPKGSKRVIQKGEKGKVAKHYEVTYENGKKVSKKLIKSDIIKESKNRVVALGTKAYHVSRSNSGSYSTLRVYSTAYTAHCTGCSGTTYYKGINLLKHPDAKVIAVDPSVIPLGSKVYVPGYGYALAADIGSAIKGNHIDVFFPTRSEALHWGAHYITIKVLH